MKDFAYQVLASAIIAAAIWAAGYLLISFISWRWVDPLVPLSRLCFAVAFLVMLFAKPEEA